MPEQYPLHSIRDKGLHISLCLEHHRRLEIGKNQHQRFS